MRDHSGQPFSFLRAFTCYLTVCLGSDADVSPVIGSRAPRLPVCVLFVCVRVSRATNALILLSSEKIRMHRMRYPSEHVSFPQSELLRL